MVKTLTLTHTQLIDFIIENVKEIKEEDRITSPEQFRAVIKNIKKLYGPKEDNSKGKDEVTEQINPLVRVNPLVLAMTDSDIASKHWYHYVIDAISLIAYLVCGVTYGIGCVVSVIADICNALLYVYTKDDYYMAGMQLAFAVVPGGEALKYLAKPLKKPLNVVFKLAWDGTKDVSKKIAKEVSKLTPSQLKLARKIFPKSLAKELSAGYNVALTTAIRFYGKVPGLKTMMTHAGFLIRALVIFIEMVWYDPGMPGQLIELIAGKNSFSDWLKKQPKIGLKIWSNILEDFENFRGAITTTPYDCSGRVFVWLNEDIVSDTDVSIQQSWLDDGYEEEDFNEENVWKEWQNGWRPKNLKDISYFTYHALLEKNETLMKKYDIYLKDCSTFDRYIKSKDEEDIKAMYLIFTELGFTESEIDDMYDFFQPKQKE